MLTYLFIYLGRSSAAQNGQAMTQNGRSIVELQSNGSWITFESSFKSIHSCNHHLTWSGWKYPALQQSISQSSRTKETSQSSSCQTSCLFPVYPLKEHQCQQQETTEISITERPTCSKPGSLWYGFSFIKDCIDIRRLERLSAGLHAGPDHVL